MQPDSVHTIQDALALVSQPQLVRVGQSNSSEASQQVQIEALPPVLVLHLERFQYDATADGIMKINKPIQFESELEIPLGNDFPLLSPVGLRIPHHSVALEIMAPVSEKSTEAVHYKLYGVLYHHGESARSGHYTVDVVHPNGDNDSEEGWLHIDDEVASAVRDEEVFLGQDNERVNERCAYMLFYRRTSRTQAR